jgi:flagellar basal body-associated protein FliL
MPKTSEESQREWRKASLTIVIVIFATLAACVIGLIVFHALPGGR